MFLLIFDLTHARHLNIRSIGYILLPNSTQAGSAVYCHLGRCCRLSYFNSSSRRTTELVGTLDPSRIVRRVSL
eukprot:4795218-Pyramimonas_sp.AAC.1